MTCSEVQEVLPEVIDAPESGQFPFDFQSHLSSCPDCSGLVSELRTISGGARQLAEDDEPSPELWLRIAAQLRAEGLIRDQEADFATREQQRVLVPARPRWRMSWLVPVAAVMLVAGTYVAKHQSAPLTSERKAPATPAPAPSPNTQSTNTTASTPSAPSSSIPASTPAPASTQVVASTSKAASSADPEQLARSRRESQEAAPSSEDDEQFLSVVSTRAPSMKATYEKQLQAVNADIRESQAYVDQNPGDADARQHLMEAYQQKALLYQIALDRIQ
jgi:hypothetical protein